MLQATGNERMCNWYINFAVQLDSTIKLKDSLKKNKF